MKKQNLLTGAVTALLSLTAMAIRANAYEVVPSIDQVINQSGRPQQTNNAPAPRPSTPVAGRPNNNPRPQTNRPTTPPPAPTNSNNNSNNNANNNANTNNNAAQAGAISGSSSRSTGIQTNNQSNNQSLESRQNQSNNQNLNSNQNLTSNPNQTSTNTNNTSLDPTTISGASSGSSSNGYNNGIEFGDTNIWYFQPAEVPQINVTTGTYTFRGYSGDFVQCPTAGRGFGISIYVAAYNENSTSDQVSQFCEEVTGYIQDMSRVAGISSLLPALPAAERQYAASTAVGYLFNGLGVQYNPPTAQSATAPAQIIVVPGNQPAPAN